MAQPFGTFSNTISTNGHQIESVSDRRSQTMARMTDGIIIHKAAGAFNAINSELALNRPVRLG
jgi:hypothetical protein